MRFFNCKVKKPNYPQRAQINPESTHILMLKSKIQVAPTRSDQVKFGSDSVYFGFDHVKIGSD